MNPAIETMQPDDRPAGDRRPPRTVLLGLAAGLLAGAVVTTGVALVRPVVAGSRCDAEPAALRVVSDPALHAVLSAVATDLEAQDHGGCEIPLTITSQDPAVTAAQIAGERGDRPDVWIPDSSVWARRATAPGTGVPADNPSVASSPLVLAVSPRLAGDGRRPGTPGIDDLVSAAAPTGGAVRWVLPEPEASAATVGALIELKRAAAGGPNPAAWFGSVIRSSSRDPVGLSRVHDHLDVAVPTTEQQVFAHNVGDRRQRVAAAYGARSFRFDYPMVVLTTERARRDRAADLLEGLQGVPGRRLLAAAGFRAADGVAGDALTAQLGAAAGSASLDETADAAAVNSAIRVYTAILRPSRLLAVIDVSGSMGRRVPGARGATRLDLAVQAAMTGLAVYPDETVVGVWAFATKLDGAQDHKVLAPLQELGRGVDGTSGRQRVAEALARLEPTENRTGLNDTTLAAVREARRGWDPTRVNSVVLITDGGNSDRDGISTKQVLRTLRHEHDPERPVAVFSIAYGPSGDLANLRKISEVTGGRAYAAPDPRQIGRVLADAIGRRSCAPDC